MPTLLSLGHGYSARALADRLPPTWQVIGTTRSPEKAERLAAQGIEPILFPHPAGPAAAIDAVGRATHLLTSVAPDKEGDPVLRDLGAAITRHAARLDWAGYLSTIGVYGDRQGGWVDETSELRPATARGRARVEAEAAWRAIPGLPLHIFRIAGIYGPGRGPFEKVRRGTARRVIKEGQVFGRIHVDDIASALLASIAAPAPGTTYNLTDDEPAPPQDVIAHAAELLEMPMPPTVDYETAELTPMARSFYAESKRVRNDRLRALMGPLRYPTYREGLAGILAAEG